MREDGPSDTIVAAAAPGAHVRTALTYLHICMRRYQMYEIPGSNTSNVFITTCNTVRRSNFVVAGMWTTFLHTSDTSLRSPADLLLNAYHGAYYYNTSLVANPFWGGQLDSHVTVNIGQDARALRVAAVSCPAAGCTWPPPNPPSPAQPAIC